jgi:hypothetical protein
MQRNVKDKVIPISTPIAPGLPLSADVLKINNLIDQLFCSHFADIFLSCFSSNILIEYENKCNFETSLYV